MPLKRIQDAIAEKPNRKNRKVVDGPDIIVTLYRSDVNVWLSIRDFGRGIPKDQEQLELLGRSLRGGAGIGLYVLSCISDLGLASVFLSKADPNGSVARVMFQRAEE